MWNECLHTLYFEIYISTVEQPILYQGVKRQWIKTGYVQSKLAVKA